MGELCDAAVVEPHHEPQPRQPQKAAAEEEARDASAEIESNASGEEREDFEDVANARQLEFAHSLKNLDGKTSVAHKRMKVENYDLTDGTVSLSLRPGWTNAHIALCTQSDGGGLSTAIRAALETLELCVRVKQSL